MIYHIIPIPSITHFTLMLYEGDHGWIMRIEWMINHVDVHWSGVELEWDGIGEGNNNTNKEHSYHVVHDEPLGGMMMTCHTTTQQPPLIPRRSFALLFIAVIADHVSTSSTNISILNPPLPS